MYGIIYTLAKWCVFIVLSANLQTPLAPSQETFPHLLMFPVVHWIFPCPITLLCVRRYLKVCPGCRCYKKGAKGWSRTFQSLHCSQNCLFIPIFHSQLPPITYFSDAFPDTPPRDRSWGPFMSNVSECVHWQRTFITTLGAKVHVHKVIACSLQAVCHGRLCWGDVLSPLPTCHSPPPSLSCHPECSPAAAGTEPPPCSASTSLCFGVGKLISLTHIYKHSFFCCGKSTQLHRIRPIKHKASRGSISSAWRVLHHADLWLLQPHASNLFHFSGPVLVVGCRSTRMFVLIWSPSIFSYPGKRKNLSHTQSLDFFSSGYECVSYRKTGPGHNRFWFGEKVGKKSIKKSIKKREGYDQRVKKKV